MPHRVPHIHVPMLQAADVIPHLGKPGHFKEGRSGRLVAETWFNHNGPSPSILAVLSQSDALAQGEFLDAFLERKIDLGDGRQPSQADVLALIGMPSGLAVMAVEGKVDESFGLYVSEWLKGASADKERRLERLRRTLGLHDSAVEQLRYRCAPRRRRLPVQVFSSAYKTVRQGACPCQGRASPPARLRRRFVSQSTFISGTDDINNSV